MSHAGIAESRFLEAEEVDRRYGLIVESVMGSLDTLVRADVPK